MNPYPKAVIHEVEEDAAQYVQQTMSMLRFNTRFHLMWAAVAILTFLIQQSIWIFTLFMSGAIIVRLLAPPMIRSQIKNCERAISEANAVSKRYDTPLMDRIETAYPNVLKHMRRMRERYPDRK